MSYEKRSPQNDKNKIRTIFIFLCLKFSDQKKILNNIRQFFELYENHFFSFTIDSNVNCLYNYQHMMIEKIVFVKCVMRLFLNKLTYLLIMNRVHETVIIVYFSVSTFQTKIYRASKNLALGNYIVGL